MENSFAAFSGLYSLTRTLRFQLKPVGKTNQHIQNLGLISKDEERAKKYQEVKNIIDRRHKKFIDDVLSSFRFSPEDLKLYSDLFDKKIKTDDELDLFDKNRQKLRKLISKKFKDHPDYKNLKGKELIKTELESVISKADEKELVHEFDQWSTYFKGFAENRENMYSEEDKTTAIAFRIVEQNLPKFLDNIKVYRKCIDFAPNIFKDIESDLLKKNCIQSLETFFILETYSSLLTQKKIDAYNALLGGNSSIKDGEKIKGLNEYINLYNQEHGTRLPLFSPLFKQILSDRVQDFSLLPIQNDRELLNEVLTIWNSLDTNEIFSQKIPNLLADLQNFEPRGIFIANDTVLTKIMQQMYGTWEKFKNAWFERYRIQHPKGERISPEKYSERMQKEYDRNKSFSISEIRDVLNSIPSEEPVQDIMQFFSVPSIPDGNGGKISLLKQLDSAYKNIESLLNTDYPEEKKLLNDKDAVAGLKHFLDTLKEMQHFFKLLSGTGKEPEKDMAFYSKLNEIIDALDPVTILYNRVRNYLCRKPYSTEKFKLNFDSVTLLDGWDENKERDCLGILLQKDGLFYLAIFKKGKFYNFAKAPNDTPCFKKIVYKDVGDPSRLIFNLLEIDGKTKKVNGHKEKDNALSPEERNPDLEQAKNQFLPPNINRIRKAGSYKTGDNFNKQDLSTFIEYYKQRVIEYKAPMTFSFKPSAEYSSIQEFQNDVKENGYKISFSNVSEACVNQLVEKGDLYLFQIWSKDFSEFSKGTPNMHTLYWKALFDPKNLEDVVFKLNGEAEIFYRKASINSNEQIVHSANTPIQLRREPKKSNTFKYDLVKDRRFTCDQFSFHVKVEINFKADSKTNLNAKIREWLLQTEDPHIIGIDRGERNLIYITVIDSSGKIKYQKSLNTIISHCREQDFSTDYHALLDQRESENDKAQKSWQTIGKIKDLKAGYLSQVIHELTRLVLQYNAVICLEDLNSGFKQGRQKVDKSVYQQFERDLIKKLQYLTDKKRPADQPLGILHGLQMVNEEISYKGLQNGIIFYIPAWCTSKIDPVTGFVNLFGSRWLQWENIDKAKTFFAKFKSIHYNPKMDLFEFSFDYSDFTEKADDSQTLWTVASYGDRLENFRNPDKQNQWDCRTVNLTFAFKELFEKYNIDFTADLQSQILAQPMVKDFWYKILSLFKLTIQLRNSKPNSTRADDDYILSPVRGKDGSFFDSRIADSSLPMDADANGAYNIARKGLWVVRKIKSSPNPLKEKTTMTQKEWLRFVQQR